MIKELGSDADGVKHIQISGRIGLQELLDFVDFVEELEAQQHNLVALYDFREALVELSIEDLDCIKLKSKYTFTSTQHIRCAFLTSNPEQTAFGIYYKLDNPHDHIYREVFTQYNAAMLWLKGDEISI